MTLGALIQAHGAFGWGKGAVWRVATDVKGFRRLFVLLGLDDNGGGVVVA